MRRVARRKLTGGAPNGDSMISSGPATRWQSTARPPPADPTTTSSSPWVFEEEVDRANRVLSLYKAAPSKDRTKLERVPGDPGFLAGCPGGTQVSPVDRRDHIGGTYSDALVHVAMRQVLWEVREVISEYGCPCLTHRSPSGGETPLALQVLRAHHVDVVGFKGFGRKVSHVRSYCYVGPSPNRCSHDVPIKAGRTGVEGRLRVSPSQELRHAFGD